MGKITAEVTPPALVKAAAATVTTSIHAQMARGKGTHRDPWTEEPAEPGAMWTTLRARHRPCGGKGIYIRWHAPGRLPPLTAFKYFKLH